MTTDIHRQMQGRFPAPKTYAGFPPRDVLGPELCALLDAAQEASTAYGGTRRAVLKAYGPVTRKNAEREDEQAMIAAVREGKDPAKVDGKAVERLAKEGRIALAHAEVAKQKEADALAALSTAVHENADAIRTRAADAEDTATQAYRDALDAARAARSAWLASADAQDTARSVTGADRLPRDPNSRHDAEQALGTLASEVSHLRNPKAKPQSAVLARSEPLDGRYESAPANYTPPTIESMMQRAGIS